MSLCDFKTVAGGEIFSAAYEVNKSKFLAHVSHVADENSARDFVQTVRKKFFDATHNCSAWILGERGDKQKSNDDGEPGGTAGNPILDAIKKNSLTNVAVVVTRYFGGIKLGAGGLIRAYSHTAALGIAAARIVQMTTFRKISLTIEYNFLATVENFLRQKKIRVDEKIFTDVAELRLLLLPAQVEKFLAELNDLTAANFLCEELGEILIPVEVGDSP